MAISFHELQAIITSKTTGFVNGLRTAGAATAQLRQRWMTAGRDVGRAAGSIGAAASRTTLAIAAIGGVAAVTFSKFESAMVRVGAVTETIGDGISDLAREQFKTLEQAALTAGEETIFSATESAEAIEKLGLAGLSTSEIIGGALESSLQLAAAAQIGISDAAKISATQMRAFGLEATELSRVNDTLVATQSRANTTIFELSQALKPVAPLAAQQNVTLETTAAILAQMADAGFRGCWSADGEVLTRDGWKHWPDVDEFDELATYNADTEHIEYQRPTALFKYWYEGEMYHVASQHVDMLVTPEHRLWAQPAWLMRKSGAHDWDEFLPAQVTTRPFRYRTGGMLWSGAGSASTVRLAGWNKSWQCGEGGVTTRTKTVESIDIDADAWAEFLGYYVAEGSVDKVPQKGNYRTVLSQRPGKVRDQMRACLDRLPFSYCETTIGLQVANKQLHQALAPLGKAPQKHVPQYVKQWPAERIRIFLEAYIDGDGCSTDRNRAWTSSRQLRDDLQELALKAGWATTYTERPPRKSPHMKDGREVHAKHRQWEIHFCRSRHTPAIDPYARRGTHQDRKKSQDPRHEIADEFVDFKGWVYCASVPNEMMIVRRNGKVHVSGNSIAGVALRRAFINLASPSKKAADILQEMGVEALDPFFVKLQKIEGALDAASSRQEALRMAAEVFGARAAPQLVAALSVGTDAISEFSQKLDEAAGLAARIEKEQLKTLSGQFQLLRAVVEGVFIDVGGRLSPALREAMQNLRDFINENKTEIVEAFANGIMSLVSVIRSLTKFFKENKEEVLAFDGALADSLRKIGEFVAEKPRLAATLALFQAANLLGFTQAVKDSAIALGSLSFAIVTTIVQLKTLKLVAASAGGASGMGALGAGGKAVIAVLVAIVAFKIARWVDENFGTQRIKKFNEALERTVELNDQLIEKQKEQAKRTTEIVEGQEDPRKRAILAAEKEAEAQKELQGIEAQRQRQLEIIAAEQERANASFLGLGGLVDNKIVEAEQKALEGINDRLSEQKSLVEDLRKTRKRAADEAAGLAEQQAIKEQEAAQERKERNTEIQREQLEQLQRANEEIDKQIRDAEQRVAGEGVQGFGQLRNFVGLEGVRGGDIQKFAQTIPGVSEQAAGGFAGRISGAKAAGATPQDIDAMVAQFLSGVQRMREQVQRLDASIKVEGSILGPFTTQLQDLGDIVPTEQLDGFAERALELRQELRTGKISLKEFEKGVKDIGDEANRAAEAAREAALLRGDFAGAGLDPQAALRQRALDFRRQQFQSQVDAIFNNRLEALGLKAQGVGNNFQRLGDQTQRLGDTISDVAGRGGKAADAFNQLGNFLSSSSGQIASLQNQISLLQQNVSLARTASERQRIQDQISQLSNKLQQARTPQAPILQRSQDSGLTRDPGLQLNQGGMTANINLPNVRKLSEINNDDVRVVVNKIENEMQRRGRRV